MYARLVIGDFMVVIHFLACYEQRQHFRELRATWACGKVRTSSVQALNNKNCCCAAGFCAAPRLPSRADTTNFRKRLKHVERGNHVEKLRRKSLVLQFQKFHINIDVPTHQY